MAIDQLSSEHAAMFMFLKHQRDQLKCLSIFLPLKTITLMLCECFSVPANAQYVFVCIFI